MGDPVYMDVYGFWWFWDETWSDCSGPYWSEEEARAALFIYKISLSP